MEENKDQPALWTMPDDLPIFTMALVAPAVGITPSTLRAWRQRGHIRLGERDSGAHANGAADRFTLRSVLTLGITAELVGVGVAVNVAFEIAKGWELMGDMPGDSGTPARREPAGLFPPPYQKYLVVGPEDYGSGRPKGREHAILAVDLADPRSQGRLAGALFDGGRAGGRAVWLNLVDRRVRSACEAALLGKNAPPEPDWAKIAAELNASAEGVVGGARGAS